jgi:hypothetical protein
VVSAFRAWVPQRRGRQKDEAHARVREDRGRGAPLLRPKVDSHNPSKQRAAGPSSAAFLYSLSSQTRGAFAQAASFFSLYRKRLGSETGHLHCTEGSKASVPPLLRLPIWTPQSA